MTKKWVCFVYQLLQSMGTVSPGLYCSPPTSQRQSDSRTHTPSWKYGPSTIRPWLQCVYSMCVFWVPNPPAGRSRVDTGSLGCSSCWGPLWGRYTTLLPSCTASTPGPEDTPGRLLTQQHSPSRGPTKQNKCLSNKSLNLLSLDFIKKLNIQCHPL